MQLKKTLLAMCMALLVTAAYSQCTIDATVSWPTPNHACVGSNLTVTGTVNLRKFNGETYSPCGGSVTVYLQYSSDGGVTWTNKTSTPASSTYSITILSTYGTGKYRIYVSNTANSCSCGTTTPYTSASYEISFNQNGTHTNGYTINGMSTVNVSSVTVCPYHIVMDNITISGQSAIANHNQWRVGVSLDGVTFTYTTWVTGLPPTSFNLNSLAALNWPTQSYYSVVLQTYNGCSIASHYVNLNVIFPANDLFPSFTYPSAICEGQSITVNGSASTGPANDHVWVIAECDQYGTVTGTPWWGPFIPGSPGTYTFPAPGSGGPTITCGKYYFITLAMQNDCQIWQPTGHIMYVNCNPTADAGSDVTVCPDDCVIIGTGGRTPTNTTYTWNPYAAPVVGYPKEGLACPSATTTYTLTVTNTVTGCTATDVVTVTVEDGTWCNPKSLMTTTPSSISVYPNPSIGKFTVQLIDGISGDIEVFDMLGKKIYSLKKEIDNLRYDIDLTGYPAGIYMIKIVVKGEQKSYKIILQ